MWTRKELKDKAKQAVKMNYWKTVLIALLLCAVSGALSASFSVGGASTQGGIPESGSISVDLSPEGGSFSVNASPEDLDAVADTDALGETLPMLSEEQLSDPDLTAEELVSSLELDEDDGGPALLLATLALGTVLIAVVLVVLAFVLAIDALIINPFVVGIERFFVRNLNQPAMVSETAYGFDHNYREVAKTMLFRDLRILLWGLLFIIPGVVKSYEYRMIPYLLADDPTMTMDRAFAESRRMMQGNKWSAFVLDLSFLGWHLLSLLTLGILEIFYVAPYQFMTNAALYERLRYEAPALAASAEGSADQVPVPPFAAVDGFVPEDHEA